MAQPNPYLTMLLNRKREQPNSQGERPVGRSSARIPFLPMIPGIFNDGGVEDAKRNIQVESDYDPMFPSQREPDGTQGLSRGTSPDRMSGIASPTISLGQRPAVTTTNASPELVQGQRYSTNPNVSPFFLQQSTIPIARAGQPPVMSPAPLVTAPRMPDTPSPPPNNEGGERDIIAEDREALIKAQRRPRSKLKAIGEELAVSERSGIIMRPGRGYEEMPYDPNYPDEIPQQTRRRLEQNAITQNLQGDPLKKALAIRDEFGDPTAAQFPVSAATKTALDNDGYGAGYTKSPLDPGYVLPQQPTEPSRPLITKPRGVITEQTAPPADPSITIRPRRALPDVSPMGSSTEPFGMRGRRTQPRDDVADSEQYLKDVRNKPRSRAKAVLEELAVWAGSGVGLPVRRMIHPGGTDVQKAERQLKTDLGLQKAATENQDAQATIALRSAQARKIADELANPDTSEQRKAELEIVDRILRSHPQGFDPNDPADVIALAKLERAGIPIPASYGKQPKERQPIKQADEDGNEYYADPDTGEPLLDKKGNVRYASRAKADKPETGVPPEVIDKNIAAIRVQQQKIDEFLKNPQNQTVVVPGQVYAGGQKDPDTQKPNPEWETAKADRNRLDAEIRDWEGKRKAVSGTAKPAKDGKFHYTPDQIRAKAEADGVPYDQLLKVLQGNKRVVIDQ